MGLPKPVTSLAVKFPGPSQASKAASAIQLLRCCLVSGGTRCLCGLSLSRYAAQYAWARSYAPAFKSPCCDLHATCYCCNTCKSAHRNLGPSCFEFLPTDFSRESCENPFERKISRNPLRNPSRKPSIPKTCFECPSSRKSCPGPWLAEFQKKDAPRA